MQLIWIYSHILLLGSLAMLILGVWMLYRRRTAVIVFFVLLVLSSAVYVFGYAMEITSQNHETIRFWSKIEYTTLPFIISLMILFILHFTMFDRKIPRIFIILPLLFSLTIMIVRQTNQFHQKYYTSIDFETFNNFTIMILGQGIWYRIFAGYNVLGILFSIFLISIYYTRVPHNTRKQYRTLLIGAVLPLIPYIIYLTNIIPSGFDLMPFFLTISVYFLYIAVFRYNLFSLIPVGRARLVEMMTDAVIVLNYQNCVVDANPSARREFGREDVNPDGQNVLNVMPKLNPYLESGEQIKANNKTWKITRTTLFSTRGKTEGTLIVAHDITELERIAREDTLTGLLNRHSWDESVKIELLHLSRYYRYGSVIFIDLDHFKKINDSYGHSVGDKVLKTVGKTLKDVVRKPDYIGRYGGEEFVAFLPESSPDEAAEVAERMRVCLMEEIEIDNMDSLSITASFGVAGCQIENETKLEDLVNAADKALYRSKQSGRNQVTLDERALLKE